MWWPYFMAPTPPEDATSPPCRPWVGLDGNAWGSTHSLRAALSGREPLVLDTPVPPAADTLGVVASTPPPALSCTGVAVKEPPAGTTTTGENDAAPS